MREGQNHIRCIIPLFVGCKQILFSGIQKMRNRIELQCYIPIHGLKQGQKGERRFANLSHKHPAEEKSYTRLGVSPHFTFLDKSGTCWRDDCHRCGGGGRLRGESSALLKGASMLSPVALLSAFLFLGQSIQPPLSEPFLVQSWKKGRTEIEEKHLDVVATRAKHPQNFTIRNKSGSSKYRLSVSPVGSSGVTVSLTPKSSLKCFFDQASCVNLLKPSNDPYQDAFSPIDLAMWFIPMCEKLDAQSRPRCNAPPIRQRRVIQIESFYVALQVTDYETAKDNPEEVLTMKLTIQFSNGFTPYSR